MPIFIPRLRRLKPLAGRLEDIRWPANAHLEVELLPVDLFGPGAAEQPRSVIVKDAPGSGIFWDAKSGRTETRAPVFLAELQLQRILRNHRLSIAFEGRRMTVDGSVIDRGDLDVVMQIVEYHIPAFLSLYTGTYVDSEVIRVSLGEVESLWELTGFRGRILTLNEESREELIERALLLADLQDESMTRVLLASLYFRQALRLESPHESRVPELNLSEIVLNLAKSLQILAGSNDQLRELARELGFTDDEIEGQLVPIALIRDEIDVAHPVGTRPQYELVEALREYCGRATDNVQALLVAVARGVAQGRISLPPLTEQKKHRRDRGKLLSAVTAYLTQPALRGIPEI